MVRSTRFLAGCAIASLMMLGAAQAQEPRPGIDPRIRTVMYSENRTVTITTTYGLVTTILFANDEEIQTVQAGDTVSFQVVPAANRRAITIKPVDRGISTNMTVITTKRAYSIELLVNDARTRGQQTFMVRFQYPEQRTSNMDAQLWKQAQANVAYPNIRGISRETSNWDYAFKESEFNKPAWIVDDGRKTLMKFTGEVPAIFKVDADRNERLVNFRRERDYIVIDEVAEQWTLRNGPDEVTCVFNLRSVPARVPSEPETHVMPRRIAGQGG
jgi:type IV secretion system protein VirB9